MMQKFRCGHRLEAQQMMAFLLSFLLGCVDGLRSLTAPAVVCWAAHFGWLHFAGTKLAFIDSPVTLIVFTLLAIGELVVDKLPGTPARTAPLGLGTRIVMGGACGFAVATSADISTLFAAAIASIGAVVGAFAGYRIRHALVSQVRLPDLAVALAEDAIAITAGLFITSRF
jgi:uncharacterized membrane protein